MTFDERKVNREVLDGCRLVGAAEERRELPEAGLSDRQAISLLQEAAAVLLD